MAWSIITPPYAEPIHLDEAKEHVRQEETRDDGQITRAIRRMVGDYERVVERSLVTRTIRLSLSGWGDGRSMGLSSYGSCGIIKLPAPPLCYVSSIQYVDTLGVTQTWSSSLYQSFSNPEEAWIAPAYGQFFPYVRSQFDAIKINYVAGYATPFTVNVATNVCTALGRTFTAGDVFRLSNSGGKLPGGLSPYTDYYILSPSGSTFSLSLTANGSAVDLTAPGEGTSFIGEIPPEFLQAICLKVAYGYESRGEESDKEPMAIESMEWKTWIGGYS